MLAVLIVVAVVIVAGVAVVAMGRGGEMAKFAPDVRPLDGDIETAADVALLRPPAAMWGYDKRATDEALSAVAQTVTDRDVEIATLRQQIAELRVPRPAGLAQSRGADQPDVPGPPQTQSQAQAGTANQAQPGSPSQAQAGTANQAQSGTLSQAQPGAQSQAQPGTAGQPQSGTPGSPPPASGPSSGTWSAWQRSRPSPADEGQPEEPG